MVLSDLETAVEPNSAPPTEKQERICLAPNPAYDSYNGNKCCAALCCTGFLGAARFHETFCICKPTPSSAHDGVAPTTENSDGVCIHPIATRGCDIRRRCGSLSSLCKCCAALDCKGSKIVQCSIGIPKRTSSDRDGVGISRSKRDLPPADYLFEIQSYSLSMDTQIEKHESKFFKAGGYTWKLILYPYGNLKSNGKGHVSLYLAIADTDKFSHNWEVNVNFKLFVFDQKNNNYLTIQDANGAVRKFNEMKIEWGFEQLISLEALIDSCNGYLVKDRCIFGAEVFVIGNSPKRECISMVVNEPPPPPTKCSFTWKFDNFLPTISTRYSSKTFTFGDREWKLVVWPNGDIGNGTRDIYLSLFLELIDCDKYPSTIVTASFKLKILDQLHNKYYDKEAIDCKFIGTHTQWGYSNFILLSDLKEVGKGYIKNNAIVMEVEIFKIDVIIEDESKEGEKGCIKEPEIIIEPPTYGNFTCRLENIPKLDLDKTYSDDQGDWKVMVSTELPNTEGIKGKHVTVYLQPKDWKRFPSNAAVDANLKIKLFDQLRNKYYEKTETRRYYSEAWSCTNLISLDDFNRAQNGYIKNNAITMEVEISNITAISPG